MKSTKANPSSSSLSSRRRFLQTAGVALAGGFGATDSFSRNDLELASDSGQCAFSEIPPDFAYLNSGTEGSMPGCVISAFQHGLNKWASDPTTSYETDPVFGKHQEMNRASVGRFLNVGMNNICLADNTTMGLSMTLMGLSFRSDDRIVMTNHEHTAIRSPLLVLQARLGLRLITRPFPPAETLSTMSATELLNTLFPNTAELRGAKALCVSHVYPTTGVCLPLLALREKADELGIEYLVVDGAQGLGMLDLTADANRLDNCDFYACPGHKWLNGPPSTGVLYIRNENIGPPEFYPTISQRMGKYVNCDDQSAACFPIAEALQVRGCSNTPGFSAMVRAMKFTDDAGGSAQVEKYILDLSKKVKYVILSQAPRSMVSPQLDVTLSSGLTVFFPFRWDKPKEVFTDRETSAWVVSELLKKNIEVRFIGFDNSGSPGGSADAVYAIRISTAYFNTAEQVDIFTGALREVLIRI